MGGVVLTHFEGSDVLECRFNEAMDPALINTAMFRVTRNDRRTSDGVAVDPREGLPRARQPLKRVWELDFVQPAIGVYSLLFGPHMADEERFTMKLSRSECVCLSCARSQIVSIQLTFGK